MLAITAGDRVATDTIALVAAANQRTEIVTIIPGQRSPFSSFRVRTLKLLCAHWVDPETRSRLNVRFQIAENRLPEI